MEGEARVLMGDRELLLLRCTDHHAAHGACLDRVGLVGRWILRKLDALPRIGGQAIDEDKRNVQGGGSFGLGAPHMKQRSQCA